MKVLSVLFRERGNAVSREALLNEVWGRRLLRRHRHARSIDREAAPKDRKQTGGPTIHHHGPQDGIQIFRIIDFKTALRNNFPIASEPLKMVSESGLGAQAISLYTSLNLNIQVIIFIQSNKLFRPPAEQVDRI